MRGERALTCGLGGRVFRLAIAISARARALLAAYCAGEKATKCGPRDGIRRSPSSQCGASVFGTQAI
jgi:hypothetical protein